MARHERPLDRDDDALSQFAMGLRLLRKDAGSPTYRELGRRAHYSAGTLSDAANGKKLPSLAVTLGYVRACGGDAIEWERRWHAVSAELLAAELDVADGDDKQSPYVGLAAFQPEDAAWFFGRDRLVTDLCARLAERRFHAVFGPSGVGKSSLLRAGVLPRLRRGVPAEVVLFTPGAHPWEECAVHLAPVTGATAAELHQELCEDSHSLHRIICQAMVGERDLVLVIDQFEEIFTLCSDHRERTGFIDGLLTAVTADNSCCRVVIGVRADFYTHCADHVNLAAALSDAQVLVGPMTTGELREAIIQPAIHAECTVEGALLAELIVEADGRAGVLPLLSHALRETWRRRRGNTLCLSGYRATGGIAGALAKTADDRYTRLGANRQLLAKQLFLRLIALGEGTEDTKRRIRRAELDVSDPDVDMVLADLAAARLITLDADTVEITHESLIKAWPRLRGWLTEDREALRTHRQLTEATAAWESLHRDSGALYRGIRLHIAREWAAGNDVLLTKSEREFLRASVAADAAEHAAARRRTRRLQQLVALLTVLLLVATIAVVTAVRAQNTATDERNIAISQKVANQSEGLRAANPALAAQLGLAAYQLSPTTEARGSLLSTFATPYATQLTSHTDGVNFVAYRPDGHIMATASDDGTARLWEVADPHHPSELAALNGRDEVYSVAFSPDGHTLATAGGDNTARLWDVTDPRHPREMGTLTGHTDRVYSVKFGPDGRIIATAGEDHTARLWDVTDLRHPVELAILSSHTARVYQAVFTAGGHTLATASGDNTARLWDVTDPRHPREMGTLVGHTDRVRSVAFGPDGRTVATAGYDSTARLWDVTDLQRPRELATLTGHTGRVSSAAFSSDGHTLATAGDDRTVRLWDISNPRHASQAAAFPGHTELIWCVVFSPDGRTVTTASWDRTVRLWDIADSRHPGPPAALAGHTGPVYSTVFSPDGHTVATGSGDGAVRLWGVADPQHPRMLAMFSAHEQILPSGHTGAVWSVAFSPDGRTLATGHDDYTARLWNVTDPSNPSELATLPGHTDTVRSVAFNPNGHTVAVASSDRTVRMWDVANLSQPREIVVEASHTGPIYSVAFSPDGRTMATASWDSTVRLWDVTDPTRLHEIAALTGHTGPVWSVAFSPDGHTVATASDDHTARLWDISDLPHPHQIAALTGHTGHLYSVAFSADGHTVASASDDHTARLWDITDLRHPHETAALTGHTNRVWSVAFSSDGHTAATGSDDNTALLRETDVARVAGRICATVHPAIARTEWDQYLAGLAFQPPCS